MNKIKRCLYFMVSCTTIYGSGILGTFYGMHWALNIFCFLTWGFTLTWIVVFLAILLADSEDKLLTTFKNMTPAWLCYSLSFTMMLILVAFGHWFYGILVLIQMFCEFNIRTFLHQRIS